MLHIRSFGLVAALSLVAVTTAFAETKSVVRRNNYFENATNSPWFNLDVAGAGLSPSQDNNQGDHTQGHVVTAKPSVAGVQAGQVSSVTVVSNYSIQGWATEENNWNDLNGIPTGITITFKTTQTFSVDEGNFLTLAPSAGNGLGITQTQGTSSNLDAGEILHVSDTQISDLAFTGSVAGFTFSNPTITNFGIDVLRSGGGTDFTEASENAGLYSVPPDASGNPTIGFGDGASGTGVAQSNVKIENGFEAAGTNFTNRYLGAWDFKVLAGSMGLRGVGFKYDLGYDINAAPVTVPGDYNQNGSVDAADYVLWRKGDLAADSNNDTVIDQADYDFWRANFGNSSAGAGAGGSAVPEPAAVALLAIGLLATISGWHRKRERSQTV
jgi:hypothetical protein